MDKVIHVEWIERTRKSANFRVPREFSIPPDPDSSDAIWELIGGCADDAVKVGEPDDRITVVRDATDADARPS